MYKFQLNMEDWNIIVLQILVCLDLPYWFPDHLHTGGTFDCSVAQSHSMPLCLIHTPGLSSVFVYYHFTSFCIQRLFWEDCFLFLFSSCMLPFLPYFL